ncbi:sensory box histidine kinase [Vibrio sp. JCM 19236]|nr:sensory box histidine kinase [Vibrio sp. JCM 19236]
MPAAIYTKAGRAIYSTLDRASGKKIGLAKGSAWVAPIKRDFPELLVVEFSKLDDALVALSDEEIDLTVVNKFVAKHHIATLGLDDLVHSGTTSYRQATAIAVHPSKPELVSLFNKVIASVDESQMTLILEKWNNLQIIEKNPWQIYILWIAAFVFGIIFIILLFNYLNRKKSIKVIKKVTQRLSNAQRVAKLGSWDVSSEGTITSLSVEAAHILGVAETKSMLRIDYVQMIYEQDRKNYLRKLDDAIDTGLLNVEYRITVDNKLKWVKEVSELKFDNHNKFVSASTTIQDISEFKIQQEKLIESQDELRMLTSKLLSVQEEERKRVARDLHDDLSQRLAVVAIDLGAVQMSVESETLGEQLKNIKHSLGKIAEDTHSLSRRLHPSILDDLGLIDALRSEIEAFS